MNNRQLIENFNKLDKVISHLKSAIDNFTKEELNEVSALQKALLPYQLDEKSTEVIRDARSLIRDVIELKNQFDAEQKTMASMALRDSWNDVLDNKVKLNLTPNIVQQLSPMIFHRRHYSEKECSILMFVNTFSEEGTAAKITQSLELLTKRFDVVKQQIAEIKKTLTEVKENLQKDNEDNRSAGKRFSPG